MNGVNAYTFELTSGQKPALGQPADTPFQQRSGVSVLNGRAMARSSVGFWKRAPNTRGRSRSRLNPIAHLGSARAHSAMCTAEDAAVLLHAMPDHPASAMRTSRSERLYRTFETVEDVRLVLHDDLKGFVVRVATNLALCGRHADNSSLARLARPSNGRPIVGARGRRTTTSSGSRRSPFAACSRKLWRKRSSRSNREGRMSSKSLATESGF
jgi:hypothetical protein